MFSGWSSQTGLFEQFAGFFGLEEIDLAGYAGRSVPMDVVLGRERTQRSKIIKQADVVALLGLLPEELAHSVVFNPMASVCSRLLTGPAAVPPALTMSAGGASSICTVPPTAPAAAHGSTRTEWVVHPQSIPIQHPRRRLVGVPAHRARVERQQGVAREVGGHGLGGGVA